MSACRHCGSNGSALVSQLVIANQRAEAAERQLEATMAELDASRGLIKSLRDAMPEAEQARTALAMQGAPSAPVIAEPQCESSAQETGQACQLPPGHRGAHWARIDTGTAYWSDTPVLTHPLTPPEPTP